MIFPHLSGKSLCVRTTFMNPSVNPDENHNKKRLKKVKYSSEISNSALLLCNCYVRNARLLQRMPSWDLEGKRKLGENVGNGKRREFPRVEMNSGKCAVYLLLRLLWVQCNASCANWIFSLSTECCMHWWMSSAHECALTNCQASDRCMWITSSYKSDTEKGVR